MKRLGWAIGMLTAALVTAGCGERGDEKIMREEKQAERTVKDDSLPSSEDGGKPESEEKADKNSILDGIDLTGADAVEHTFQEVSVHDPSVIRAGDTWYIFGSHLAAAKSDDLMNWTLIDSGVREDNRIIPDAKKEMEEAFTWAKTDTFWAPDVIQLADGRFYMYYCNCEGSSPRSALGVAVADQPEGPYQNLGVILKSGQGAGEPDEEGGVYDATQKPNAVDPDVFFDQEGRLWMVYGSYSGGIFILELNPETGMPLESGYGKKLLGGNHLRIEGPYMLYSPETDYYYLFLSFGGLDSDGGYNIRVCRSRNPDGPFVDAEGNRMEDCKGKDGSFFDDSAAGKYGVKLMGSFSFPWKEGENGRLRAGYVSPGHNSAYYKEETGEYFLIFHTRFEGQGEKHQVRVHQMYLNADGWFVVSPHRYAREEAGEVKEEDIPGPYRIVSHLHNISADIREAEDIVLAEDHTVTGGYEGTWELDRENGAVLTLNGIVYRGKWIRQWDQFGYKNVMTFTALSDKGYAVWGSGYMAR